MRLKYILTVVVLSAPLLCHAGIMADMNKMFMSNTTAPGTISTKDRVGSFGGSFSMRAPIRSVNVVAFDAPRLNAGCGGIDLYGGSFSFINSQQLVQIFRSVASNAAGLAFKAAIKAISPSLDALISEFQTLMQNMNNLAKNSCQLAHVIVDPAEKAIANALDGDGAVGTVQKNMFTDSMASLTGYLADANNMFKKAGEVTPKLGNQAMKGIISSGASVTLGLAGLVNIDGSTDDASNPNSLNNRLLISVTGYEVSGLPCSNTNANGQPNTSQAVSTNNLGTIACTGVATITLDDLFKGGGTGSINPSLPLTLYECLNPSGSGTPNGGFDPQICTQMKSSPFHYAGVLGWVNTMLFGSPDPSNAISADSIVGKFNSGASFKFSTGQAQFINQSGLPLTLFLTKTSNPNERIAIAQKLGGHAGNCVTALLGNAIYKAANNIQNNGGYILNEDSKKRIDQMRTDYLAKQDLCHNSKIVLETAQQINEGIRIRSASAK